MHLQPSQLQYHKKAFLSSVGVSIPEEKKCTVKEQLAPQQHTFRQSKAMNLENMLHLKSNLEKFNAITRNYYALFFPHKKA